MKVMKKLSLIVIVLFISAQASERKPDPSIVFLKGTACSGRTEICKEIPRLDTHWKSMSDDDIWIPIAVTHMEHMFPEDFQLIAAAIERKNIFPAVRYDQVFFQTEDKEKQAACLSALVRLRRIASSDENNTAFTQRVRQAAEAAFQAEAKKYLLEGFNVIVDSWFSKDTHIGYDSLTHTINNGQQKIHRFSMLTYASLATNLTRLYEQNERARKTGDASLLRLHNHILHEYTEAHDFVTFEHPAAIDILEREQLNKCFDQVEAKLATTPQTAQPAKFTRFEMTVEYFREKIKSRIPEAPKVYVVPKANFDFCVKTDTKTPEENAREVLEYVRKNT